MFIIIIQLKYITALIRTRRDKPLCKLLDKHSVIITLSSAHCTHMLQYSFGVWTIRFKLSISDVYIACQHHLGSRVK